MNASQRRYYFTTLWPNACEAQGWDTRNDTRRRDVTIRATGKDSTTALTQWEITKLFDYLKLLADDANLKKAMPVANPEIGHNQHEQRQLIHAIQSWGFTTVYVQKVAEAACRAAHVSQWTELPPAELKKLRMTIKARAMRAAELKADRDAALEKASSKPETENCPF